MYAFLPPQCIERGFGQMVHFWEAHLAGSRRKHRGDRCVLVQLYAAFVNLVIVAFGILVSRGHSHIIIAMRSVCQYN